jgi:hypothetical protein
MQSIAAVHPLTTEPKLIGVQAVGCASVQAVTAVSYEKRACYGLQAEQCLRVSSTDLLSIICAEKCVIEPLARRDHAFVGIVRREE